MCGWGLVGLGKEGVDSCFVNLSGGDDGDSSKDTAGRVDSLYGDGLIGGDSDLSVCDDLMCCGGLGKEGVDSCSGGDDCDSSRDTAGRVDLLYRNGLIGGDSDLSVCDLGKKGADS
jgi:hypothetical protein